MMRELSGMFMLVLLMVTIGCLIVGGSRQAGASPGLSLALGAASALAVMALAARHLRRVGS